MHRIGLTGGIAAGKSEVQTMLLSREIPVLDTDKVAHEVMRAGTQTFERVVEVFGKSIVNASGEIDRPVLGRMVFSDHEALRQLNAIVHPEVGRQWRQWLRARESQANISMAVVAGPLLFECGLEKEFDGVLCVWAPEQLMKSRLCQRGLDEAQAKQRIQSQWPVDQKARHSTWILKNDRDLAYLQKQVRAWWLNFNL